MRQTAIHPSINLEPGDRFHLTHEVSINIEVPRKLRLVGWRWEPVFAEDLNGEELERLEATAHDEVIS